MASPEGCPRVEQLDLRSLGADARRDCERLSEAAGGAGFFVTPQWLGAWLAEDPRGGSRRWPGTAAALRGDEPEAARLAEPWAARLAAAGRRDLVAGRLRRYLTRT